MRKHLPFLSNFANLGFIQVSNAVIQILLFPLIIHIIGLSEFGYVSVANSYAAVAALLINYGTNQSGIKDVAIHKHDRRELSTIFYTIYCTKAILFLFCLAVLGILYWLQVALANYFLFATVIVLAEVCNPFFFFTGMEKLLLFNMANLLAKLASAAAIILLVTSSRSSAWVNLYLGAGSLFFYVLLSAYAIKKYQLVPRGVSAATIVAFFQKNFYLVGNNLAVQLQQSFFVFTLSGVVDPLVLGAYTLCDKILWSFRLLLIAFSSALYPRAAVLYHEDKTAWFRQKRKLDLLLTASFLLAAFAIYLLAPFVVTVLTKTNDPLTITYMRCIAVVPLLAALSTLNVLELLISNKYRYLFVMGIVLLVLSIILSFLFVHQNPVYFGYYPLIIETCSLLLCVYLARKNRALQFL